MNQQIIANNFKKICKKRGYTQQAAADMVGKTFQQIQKYQSGKNRISADVLFEFSKGLKVNIKEFYRGCK
jgi:transcriptional regulator with XRE-family HTH domain